MCVCVCVCVCVCACVYVCVCMQKQSLGLSRMSPSESRHVIQVLTRLVTRHSPPATATTTLPTTATNTMTNTSEQQPGQVAPTDALPGNVPRITQQGVVTDGQGAVGDVQGVAVSSVGTGQGALGDAGEGQNGSVRKRGRSSAQCASVPGVGSAGGVRGTGQGAGGGSGALQSKLLAQLADLAAGGTVTRVSGLLMWTDTYTLHVHTIATCVLQPCTSSQLQR